MKTRYDQHLAAFLKYHRANPTVWKLFDKFTLEMIAAGHAHCGVSMIINRIRWEAHVRHYDPTKEFKIANAHSPFYARVFMLKHPEHEGFFRICYQTSRDKPATDYKFTPKDIRHDSHC